MEDMTQRRMLCCMCLYTTPQRADTLAAVDKVLESCFQLISLFFMTIGRTTEVPAAYAMTSTIKRLLDHLTEASLFSPKDLTSISNTLGRLEGIIQNTNSQHSPYLVELLAHREELCKSSLANLRNQLDQLDEPLQAIYERLISIMRSMSLANTKSKVMLPREMSGGRQCTRLTRAQFSVTEVQKLKSKLQEIDDTLVDGNFVSPEGKEYRGSELVSGLVRRCLQWSDIVLERCVIRAPPSPAYANTARPTEKGQSQTASETSTTSSSTSVTILKSSPSHKRGRSARRICTTSSGSWTGSTRRGWTATGWTRTASRPSSTSSGRCCTSSAAATATSTTS